MASSPRYDTISPPDPFVNPHPPKGFAFHARHPPAPPAAHTWRDFFIHIATIVVGLLIAVGLEQTVELIHHHHQRAELNASLYSDTQKTIQDTEDVARFSGSIIPWLNGTVNQIDDAIDSHKPLADPAPAPQADFDAPDDPAWKAARSSGLLELLSQQDIKAYSEVDGILVYAETLHVNMNANDLPLRQFTSHFMRHGSTRPDLSHATPEQLQRYRDLLIAYRDGIAYYAVWCHNVHGAEVAILRGERDLNRIQKAER